MHGNGKREILRRSEPEKRSGVKNIEKKKKSAKEINANFMRIKFASIGGNTVN
jgi:hypothetical protein